MSFQRPGSRSAGAFGVSFGARRGGGGPSGPGAPSGGAPPPQQPPPGPPRPAAPAAGGHLPAARYRRQILYHVESHATVILVGETGSGKTTQVPRFLLEAGWADGGAQVGAVEVSGAAGAGSSAARCAGERPRAHAGWRPARAGICRLPPRPCRPFQHPTAAAPQIVCTQPRRMAAVTVAQRVAEEVGCPLGGAVGYAIRFEEVASQVGARGGGGAAAGGFCGGTCQSVVRRGARSKPRRGVTVRAPTRQRRPAPFPRS
jgi:hypothetical protein